MTSDLRRDTQGRMMTALRFGVLVALLVACVMEGGEIVRRIAVETHIPMTDFLSRGRAVLNGYIPYRDHLDVKAPGVIFLGAFSLLLTGDGRAEWFMRIGMLLAMPILMTGLAIRLTRSRDLWTRWILAAAACVFGSELLLFTAIRGGSNLNNAEPYGVFFALLYLCVVAWDRRRMSRLRIVLASLFLLGAIGMKEPFLLTVCAMSILIAPDVRFFLRSFLLPLAVALLLGTLILAVLGYLIPYLTIDIPTILGDRMNAPSSLQFRGLMSFRLVEDITQYSPIGPLWGVFVLLLWSFVPLLKFHDNRKTLWVATIAVFLLSYCVYLSGIFWIVWERLDYSFSIQSSLVQWLVIRYIASAILLIPVLWWLFGVSRKLFWAVLLSGIALYLTTVAIGSGSFLAQHFILAIPVYAGLFVLYCENPKYLLPVFLIALAPFFHPETDDAQLIRKAEEAAFSSSQYKSVAAEADRLMDRCAFEQYYALGAMAGINTYTQHSPTDLAYAEVSDHPGLRQRFMERLRAAPVIFTDNDYLQYLKEEDVRAALATYFVQEQPACAQGFAFTDHRMVMLFRKNMEDPMASPPPELPELQLRHFLEEFTGKSPVSTQEEVSIKNVVLRELGLTAAPDSTTVHVRMEKQFIRLTVMDAAKTAVFGIVILHRTDGTIVSKSTERHP